CSAVPELNGDGIVGMTWGNPSRSAHTSAAVFQFHQIHPRLAVLAAMDSKRLFQSEPLGRDRADKNGVVPGQLAERLGHLLQPAVVGEAAIVHGGIGSEVDFQRFGAGSVSARRSLGLLSRPLAL